MGAGTKRRNRINNSLVVLGFLLALATLSPAAAQEWPTRPITLVVPFAAGGTTDLVGRPLAQLLVASLANGNHQPAGVFQLVQERLRNGWRAGRDRNRVVRRQLRVA